MRIHPAKRNVLSLYMHSEYVQISLVSLYFMSWVFEALWSHLGVCNTDESRVKENRNVFIIYHYFDGVTKKFIFLVMVLETGNLKKKPF